MNRKTAPQDCTEPMIYKRCKNGELVGKCKQSLKYFVEI